MNLNKGEIISGDNLKGVLGKDNIENDVDVKRICAAIGLKPIKILDYIQ